MSVSRLVGLLTYFLKLGQYRDISYSGLEIFLYLSNFRKEVSQLTDWQTYKKFVINWKYCKKIPGMSPKIVRKIYYPGQEISLYCPIFSKDVSQLTDWQTYKKFKTILNQCKNIPGMSKKIWKRVHPELKISLYLSNFNNEVG